LRGGGTTQVCYFTLLKNEFAGKDDKGDSQERKVAISFTAFGKKAELISEQVCAGDQLIVGYRVANNDREQNGAVTYNFSFIVEEFDFGAPGEIKRGRLAQAKENGSDQG
jgi:single-strand DNA-binding protein